MKRITGRLTEKNGKWYAVINLYDANGKRKEKWQNLHLDVKRGNKTEANHRLMEVVAQYNSEDMYLSANMTHAEREKRRLAECTVDKYVAEWLDSYKSCCGARTTKNISTTSAWTPSGIFLRQSISVRISKSFSPKTD